MILICPNCATRYKLPSGAVGPNGRTVRCKSCGHRWQATPDSLADAAALALPQADIPAEGEASTKPPERPPGPSAEPVEPAPLPPPIAARPAGRGERAIGAVSWLSLALLVLLLAAVYVGRNQVVEAFPVLAPWYQKVGLRVAVRSGLELRNLAYERVEDGGRPVAVVTGEIHNAAGEERVLPRIRVALEDRGGTEIEFDLFDAPVPQLTAGASTRFEARLLDPPDAAERYSVTLAEGP
jgi:predicted Zn finger-like uncharacterized protein